jgi:hypothetical protein
MKKNIAIYVLLNDYENSDEQVQAAFFQIELLFLILREDKT